MLRACTPPAAHRLRCAYFHAHMCRNAAGKTHANALSLASLLGYAPTYATPPHTTTQFTTHTFYSYPFHSPHPTTICSSRLVTFYATLRSTLVHLQLYRSPPTHYTHLHTRLHTHAHTPHPTPHCTFPLHLHLHTIRSLPTLPCPLLVGYSVGSAVPHVTYSSPHHRKLTPVVQLVVTFTHTLHTHYCHTPPLLHSCHLRLFPSTLLFRMFLVMDVTRFQHLYTFTHLDLYTHTTTTYSYTWVQRSYTVGCAHLVYTHTRTTPHFITLLHTHRYACLLPHTHTSHRTSPHVYLSVLVRRYAFASFRFACLTTTATLPRTRTAPFSPPHRGYAVHLHHTTPHTHTPRLHTHVYLCRYARARMPFRLHTAHSPPHLQFTIILGSRTSHLLSRTFYTGSAAHMQLTARAPPLRWLLRAHILRNALVRTLACSRKTISRSSSRCTRTTYAVCAPTSRRCSRKRHIAPRACCRSRRFTRSPLGLSALLRHHSLRCCYCHPRYRRAIHAHILYASRLASPPRAGAQHGAVRAHCRCCALPQPLRAITAYTARAALRLLRGWFSLHWFPALLVAPHNRACTRFTTCTHRHTPPFTRHAATTGLPHRCTAASFLQHHHLRPRFTRTPPARTLASPATHPARAFAVCLPHALPHRLHCLARFTRACLARAPAFRSKRVFAAGFSSAGAPLPLRVRTACVLRTCHHYHHAVVLRWVGSAASHCAGAGLLARLLLP